MCHELKSYISPHPTSRKITLQNFTTLICQKRRTRAKFYKLLIYTYAKMTPLLLKAKNIHTKIQIYIYKHMYIQINIHIYKNIRTHIHTYI